MAGFSQKPRYSRAEGERGFVFLGSHHVDESLVQKATEHIGLQNTVVAGLSWHEDRLTLFRIV